MSREKTADSLDFLAEVFEPITTITSNEKVKDAYKNDRRKLVKTIISECKDEVTDIIEAFDKADGVEIEYNGISLFRRLIKLLNDYGSDLAAFFPSQDQRTENESSGSPMENTEAEEK